jgi:hypothetical protein
VDGYCPVEKNDEGHDICTITGLCVKTVSFSNEEFVDTACCLADTPQCLTDDAVAAGGVLMMDDAEDVCPSFPLPSSWLNGNSSEKQKQHPPQSLRTLVKRKFCESELQPSMPNAVISSVSCRYKRRRKELLLSAPAAAAGSIAALLPAGLRHGGGTGVPRCSVNKKNRYRSWVYHRVTRPSPPPWCHSGHDAAAPPSEPWTAASLSGTPSGGRLQPHRKLLVAASKVPPQWQQGSEATCMRMHAGNNRHSGGAGAAPAVVIPQTPVALAGPPWASLPDPERIHGLIQTYVEDVLCSHKWKQSMLLEVHVCA